MSRARRASSSRCSRTLNSRRMRTPAAISVFQDIRAADAELAVLSGHGDHVISAAYSPDGTRIVTASYDKTARIWDARTGAQLAVLSGHGDQRRIRRLLARRHPHRHRVGRQDRAHLGCAHRRAARGALRPWRYRRIPPPTRPTARASSPPRTTRPRASGMRAAARSSRCSPAMATASTPPPTRPTARASSPRRTTRPRASGMRAPGAQLAVLSGHGDRV